MSSRGDRVIRTHAHCFYMHAFARSWTACWNYNRECCSHHHLHDLLLLLCALLYGSEVARLLLLGLVSIIVVHM